jgi:hypothetical protein
MFPLKERLGNFTLLLCWARKPSKIQTEKEVLQLWLAKETAVGEIQMHKENQPQPEEQLAL